MNLSVTTRLAFIKNILVLALLLSLTLTWKLWWPDRSYPLMPGSSGLSQWPVIGFLLPLMFVLTLIAAVLFRRPRMLIALSVLLAIGLLMLDTGRMQYWFYFYVLLLVLLAGYNWRVDNANHYTATFNGIRITIAGIYLLAAFQHFSAEFVQGAWMQFIKPFERFSTPEQCAYLARIAYAIPLVELFIALGLFFKPTRMPAVVFAILFHLFSFIVLLLQNDLQSGVLVWQIAMICFVLCAFAGEARSAAVTGFSFGLYPAIVLCALGIFAPLYFAHKNVGTSIDLMQSEKRTQYVYVYPPQKQKFPLYVQSFALQQEGGMNKLCVSAWRLHETGVRVQLNPRQVIHLTNVLNEKYGTELLVALPAQKQEIALK